ncbi:hypothetical protein BIV60_09350 [Bacillus sp. MUM 116]|nr:hypothetical protein BIV60_09350 [Bacillus sp. MUM 116]
MEWYAFFIFALIKCKFTNYKTKNSFCSILLLLILFDKSFNKWRHCNPIAYKIIITFNLINYAAGIIFLKFVQFQIVMDLCFIDSYKYSCQFVQCSAIL